MAPTDPTAGYLGFGLNSVHDKLAQGDSNDQNDQRKANRAVEGEVIAGGLGGNTRCSVCRTASEVARAMQRQIGGSLTGLGFLPLLGGKMAFYESLKTTIFSLSVVVHAWRVSASGRLVQPHRAAGIQTPRTEAELEDFVQFYGDSYISSVDLGGECFGVYTFRCETREQAQGVEKALQVGGLVSGVQLGANLHQTLEAASRSSGITIAFQSQVWGCSDISGLTPETLVPYALGFSGKPLDAPILMDLAAVGYENVPDIGTAFQPVATNRNLFTRPNGLLRQRQRLQELINQIVDTRDTLAAYARPLAQAGQLDAMQTLAKQDLAAIDALVEAYTTKPAAPLQPPQLQIQEVKSPKIVAKVWAEPTSRIGRQDNPNGQPFPFPYDFATAVQNRVRLVGIGMDAGWRVDQLRFRYSKLADSAVKEVSHGGTPNKGKNLGDFSFAEGQGISGIYSEFGSNIDKLRLDTSQGTLENWGDKGDKQHPVDWHPGPGQVVLGFSGRSDDIPNGAVYALEAVVASIEGIDWLPIDAIELEDS